MNRRGILITARTKSTRLPKKVLLPLGGQPMLVQMIRRLKRSQWTDLIVVNTSHHPDDDILVELARAEGVRFHRGSEDDVLLRIRDAARAFDLAWMHVPTADNPLIDPEILDWQMLEQERRGLDYSRVVGLPIGTYGYGLRREAVEKVCEIKLDTDTEIWGRYFTDPGIFNVAALHVPYPELQWPELRLTVDTAEDFEVVRAIFDHFGDEAGFTLTDIVEFLNRHPDTAMLNRDIVQRSGGPALFHDDLGTKKETS